MSYTDDQKALISGLIGTQFMGRNLTESLRERFVTAFGHLQDDHLSTGDLSLIASALELMTPQSCPSCNKESYRDMIEALTVTRLMLSKATV